MITVLQCRHHFSMSNFWHPSLRAISSPLWNSRGIVYKKSLHSFVEVISGASQPLCQLCMCPYPALPPDETWLAVAASHCCSLPASLPAAAAAAYPAAAAPVTAPKPAQRSLNSSSSTTAARVWTSLLAWSAPVLTVWSKMEVKGSTGYPAPGVASLTGRTM